MKLLGYNPDAQIAVSDLQLSDEQPSIGDEITISFTVTSREAEACKLMIDYVIHFMKANGKQAPKVFKAAKKTLAPGQSLTIEKRHSFQQRSTRKHCPGKHSLEVQINGVRYGKVAFELIEG